MHAGKAWFAVVTGLNADSDTKRASGFVNVWGERREGDRSFDDGLDKGDFVALVGCVQHNKGFQCAIWVQTKLHGCGMDALVSSVVVGEPGASVEAVDESIQIEFEAKGIGRRAVGSKFEQSFTCIVSVSHFAANFAWHGERTLGEGGCGLSLASSDNSLRKLSISDFWASDQLGTLRLLAMLERSTCRMGLDVRFLALAWGLGALVRSVLDGTVTLRGESFACNGLAVECWRLGSA